MLTTWPWRSRWRVCGRAGAADPRPTMNDAGATVCREDVVLDIIPAEMEAWDAAAG
jgi:hypothetical protein